MLREDLQTRRRPRRQPCPLVEVRTTRRPETRLPPGSQSSRVPSLWEGDGMTPEGWRYFDVLGRVGGVTTSDFVPSEPF